MQQDIGINQYWFGRYLGTVHADCWIEYPFHVSEKVLKEFFELHLEDIIMTAIDIKRAEGDMELVLSYLDYFCYLDKGASENLRAWLSTYRRPHRMDPYTLNAGETHVWGPFTMTNMGTKRFVITLEVREL